MDPMKEVVPTSVQTAVDRSGQPDELAYLAPAAAAALALLADAVTRRGLDADDVVQVLKDSGVHTAFADVLSAASSIVMESLEDPYEFDGRLHADNLSGAAGEVRDVFRWL
ncbi:hypothetical protein [Streptomyces sp. NPDC017940]|uniref:hypothetical protein n=1 Tax=Streptomyces sp. NPDC017940 TaxID=3365017 RepID=UPI0037AF4940